MEKDEVRIHPAKFKKVYRNWLENIKDWCISRQLWWGHRIPAWYSPGGDFVIALTAEEALERFSEKGIEVDLVSIEQDEDVLDTWFSSWLWPFSVFDWNRDENNKDLQYYYPTNDLVTGHDIIFFWVARMIMAGYHFTGKKPFENVYFTGMVRDKQGRKMSKSLGNSPDALSLLDRFGADGVRVGMLLSAPAGNDLHFDESLCLQGRNFANKLWNAFRLIKGWEVDEALPASVVNKSAIQWFDSRLRQTLDALDQQFSAFRISEGLMTSYKLIWDDFCSWYLEMVKPEFGEKIDRHSMDRTIAFMDEISRIIHPFMPFISEEIWQNIDEREGESIVNSTWPEGGKWDEGVLSTMEFNMELIAAIRQVRSELNLGKKEKLNLICSVNDDDVMRELVIKMAGLEEVSVGEGKGGGFKNFVVRNREFSIPLEEKVDADEERKRINKELEYIRGFLQSVEKKLSNERFVSNAPENVVAIERKKKEDAQAKVKLLEKQLETL